MFMNGKDVQYEPPQEHTQKYELQLYGLAFFCPLIVCVWFKNGFDIVTDGEKVEKKEWGMDRGSVRGWREGGRGSLLF